MGIRGKLLGNNAKILPGSMAISRTAMDSSWDSDDGASTGVKTPMSDSTRSSSSVSTRPNSRGSSAFPTPRGFTQRRRPLIDVSTPTSTDSRRSPWDTPTSPWTKAHAFERKKGGNRNDLSHLVGPVQPWNDYIESYAKHLVEKVGGSQVAWTDVMSISNAEVRRALYLNGRTPRGSNKPHQLPQDVSKVLQALLDSLPAVYKNDTAKLTFALHERPFYSLALQKHVELVLWGIVSDRNEWM